MESNQELTLDEFISKLSEAIAADGGNQSSFARKIGVSRNYINNVVRGERVPGDGLCRALGYERVFRFKERETNEKTQR